MFLPALLKEIENRREKTTGLGRFFPLLAISYLDALGCGWRRDFRPCCGSCRLPTAEHPVLPGGDSDYAQRHRAGKRGGDADALSLDDTAVLAQGKGRDLGVVALDDSLDVLAQIDARKAQVVELRLLRLIMHFFLVVVLTGETEKRHDENSYVDQKEPFSRIDMRVICRYYMRHNGKRAASRGEGIRGRANPGSRSCE